jgi:hypothetical protein
MSSASNGTITLKAFGDLAKHLDLHSLPPGPPDADDTHTSGGENPADDSGSRNTISTSNSSAPILPAPVVQPAAPQDLTSLIARLASLSSSLETAACEDARAREQASLELARYETLAAERREAERALAEARQVRATAELLSSQAFTEDARAQAAQHAAVARAAELACAELLAERTRAADELASRPHLARVVADRRRREQEQAEAVRRAEQERAARLADGIAAARQALTAGRLDEARRLLAPLARDFPTSDEVQSVVDVVKWRARQLVVGPAQEALREARGRALRDDPERAVGRLAGVQIDGLPEDLARQVFGVWSNACAQLVQQRGWHEPRHYSPATSRGVVLARRAPEDPYEVVSALGMGSEWRVGEVVTTPGVLRAARPFQAR